MKLKSFCTGKETIIIVAITEWEKVFAMHPSDKGLIFRNYKALKQKNKQHHQKVGGEYKQTTSQKKTFMRPTNIRK